MNVIKLGNRTFEHALSKNSLNDLRTVYEASPTILVHGGGDTVTSIAEKLGVQQSFITSPEGFKSRYTDSETIQVYTMVIAGKINKEIVSRLQQNSIPAVGISGLDGSFIRAERKKRIISKDPAGRRHLVEGGYTGRISNVDRLLPQSLLASKFLPVVAPIAMGTEYEPLNIDGDRAAAHIAAEFQADSLVLMTDVPGLLLQNELVRHLTMTEAKKNLGIIGPGMITKVYAALEALSTGVGKVVIAPANVSSPYSSALSGATGTRIEP